MATTTEKLSNLNGAKLVEFLEGDERVRDWLAGPRAEDGSLVADGGALLGTKAAAEFLGVERQRLWRWERAGRIKPVSKTGATPLYARADLLPIKAELDAEREAEAAEA
jgi:hypothetical protein